MNLEGIVWKLYDMSNWIMKLVYLNVLWILFSVIGLVVFGFFPATASVFAVTRKWILGESDIPIFKTFWNHYKSNFFQVNLIGLIILLLGIILYVDLRFFQTSTDSILISFLTFVIIFALLIFSTVVLYIFPVYVHFKFKTLEYIKQSFIVVIGKPLNTIMMIVGSYLLYVVLSTIPVLILFVGGSLSGLLIMWIAMRSFPRYEIGVSESK